MPHDDNYNIQGNKWNYYFYYFLLLFLLQHLTVTDHKISLMFNAL